MRALVTGGTGFVGSNLVAGLTARGISVRVLHRAGSSVAALAGLAYDDAIGDVLGSADELIAAVSGCDWVFHAAAIADYWRRSPADLYRVNVEGTRNVLAAARHAGVARFVFTSSIAAMGNPPAGQRLDETSTFAMRPARFRYGHSKHLAEIEVQRAVTAGLPAVIVNPGIVIGARDLNLGAGSLILEAGRGRLRVAPPGGATFVAVTDVVRTHLAAAEVGRIGERYIVPGTDLRYRDAFRVICDVVGLARPPRVLPRWTRPILTAGLAGARAVAGRRVPIDTTQLRLSFATIYADGGKATDELSVTATPLRDAVQAAYAWYRDNGYLPPARRRAELGV